MFWLHKTPGSRLSLRMGPYPPRFVIDLALSMAFC